MRVAKRIAALGLLLGAVVAGGCTKYIRVARAHGDAQGRLDYVQRSNCATNQKMLNKAVADTRDRDPYALDGVATGSREWYRAIARDLPMAMPCTGGGKYVDGPGGEVVCSLHGAASSIDMTHPDAGRTQPGRSGEPGPPPEIGGEALALGSFGLGFVFLLVAGYNYTAGGDDVDLVEELREHPVTPPGQVTPGAYLLSEGVVDAEETLLAPRARTPVAFYVYRQLEEWQQQDKNKIWHTITRELKEEKEVVPFLLRGKGGVVEVAAGGARLVGKRLLRDIVGASGSNTSHGGGGLGITGKYRNHRYIHEVEGLEVGQEAVVIGSTVPGTDGQARFEKRPEEERPYVVSARSRQELLQRAKDSAGVSRLFMIGFGVLAVIFLGVGFLIPTGGP